MVMIIRKELRYQIGCIRRNLDYIEGYAVEYGLCCLLRVQSERLLTIVVFYEQQNEMPDTKTHSRPHCNPVTIIGKTNR